MALSRAAGDRLLAAARRAEGNAQAPPGRTLGLEQEFVVRAHGRSVDFRTVLQSVALPGAIIDPGDRHARRLLSGIVITADAREAEIALPPLRRRHGYAATMARRAEIALATLKHALPADLELEGYSTHLSVSMPDALNDAVCQLYARTFSAAAVLLMDAAGSDGLLLRPRPGRTEVGVDYLSGGLLRVAAMFATASVRACAAAVTGAAVALPRELKVRVDEGVERFGWYVDRRAFGDDLLVAGRAAQLTGADGSAQTGQEALDEAWQAVRPWLDGAAEADVARAERILAGDEPLPHEVARSSIVSVPATLASRRTGKVSTPFGDAIRPRRRRNLDITARLATWDYTVFAVSLAGKGEVFVSVPSGALRIFLAELDAGRLDRWLRGELTAGRAGHALVRWEQTRAVEVFATLGSGQTLVRPERMPVGATANGDRAGKALETGTIKPEETITGGGPSWLFIGGLILIGLVILIGGGIGISLLGGGAPPTPPNGLVTPAPIATPSTVLPPTTTPQVAVTPSLSPTPFAVVTPSPSPALPIEVVTIGDYLTSLGVDETTQQALDSLIATDAPSDWIEQPPPLDPSEADMVGSLTFEANLGPEFLSRFPACGIGLICGTDETGLPGTSIGLPGEYYVYLMQMRGPILGTPTTDAGYFELGVVNFDFTPAGGGSAIAFDRGPGSFLTGSNTAYSIRFAVPSALNTGAMFRLVHGENDPFFHSEATTGFAFVQGNVMGVFIPDAEWDGAADYRLYGYYQSNTAGAVSDTVADIAEPMTPFVPGDRFLLPSGGVIGPSTVPELSMNNAFGDQDYARCSVTGTVTWTPSDPAMTLTGNGSIVIEGPTLAGTQTVAAAGNQIQLRLKFDWAGQPRTWTVTLTSVDGQPVSPAPAGANGSQFTYSSGAFPNC